MTKRPNIETLAEVADRLMAVRSSLNPNQHEFMWNELTLLAQDVRRLMSGTEPQTRQEPVAWRSKQAGSKFWQVHVNDPTEAVEKYATVAYEIAPLFACSTCGGTGKVKSKNPERDKAWEVPCPACSVTRPQSRSGE